MVLEIVIGWFWLYNDHFWNALQCWWDWKTGPLHKHQWLAKISESLTFLMSVHDSQLSIYFCLHRVHYFKMSSQSVFSVRSIRLLSFFSAPQQSAAVWWLNGLSGNLAVCPVEWAWEDVNAWSKCLLLMGQCVKRRWPKLTNAWCQNAVSKK